MLQSFELFDVVFLVEKVPLDDELNSEKNLDRLRRNKQDERKKKPGGENFQ